MSKPITVYAHAKINLTLSVLGKRPDGYHELDGIMASVSLCDDITLTPNPPAGGWFVTGGPDYLPTGGKNHIIAAARAFSETANVRMRGLHARIVKRIPVGAGLGGGSADAAATLAALNDYFQTGLTLPELAGIGAVVGSDVPYCVHGGIARVSGRGETVQPLDVPLPDCRIVIVKPKAWLSTGGVFSRIGVPLLGGVARSAGMVNAMIAALERGDLSGVAAALHNDLAEAAASLCPEIDECLTALKKAGAIGAALSGSGPAVFGLFPPGVPYHEPLRHKNWEIHECNFTSGGSL